MHRGSALKQVHPGLDPRPLLMDPSTVTPDDPRFDSPRPPEDFGPALRALWHLRRGGLATGRDWAIAHEIAQAHTGRAPFDAIHALIHRIEGDSFNADYWYRRAGRAPADDVAAEWRALVAEIPG